MYGFSGFAQGFQQRGDQNRRSRRELAQAFQTFRQQNPTATLAEMQQYIDQMAGNSNYLRGGMPSGEVLRGIANQNAERAAQERADAELARIGQRASLMGQLTAQADSFLSNLEGEEDEIDFDEQMSVFQNQLGIEDPEALGVNLGSIFNANRLGTLRTEAQIAEENRIYQLLERNPELTVDGLLAREGVTNRTVAQRAYDNVQRRLQRERDAEAERQAERAQDMRNAVLREAREVLGPSLMYADEEEAAEEIFNFARSSMTPQAFARAFGEDATPRSVAQYANIAIAPIQARRNAELFAFNEERRTAGLRRAQAARENNVTLITEDQRIGEGPVRSALLGLGQNYALSPSLINAAIDAGMRAIEEGIESPFALQQAIMEDPQVAPMLASANLDAIAEQQEEPLVARPIDEYFEEVEQGFTAAIQETETRLEQAAGTDQFPVVVQDAVDSLRAFVSSAREELMYANLWATDRAPSSQDRQNLQRQILSAEQRIQDLIAQYENAEPTNLDEPDPNSVQRTDPTSIITSDTQSRADQIRQDREADRETRREAGLTAELQREIDATARVFERTGMKPGLFGIGVTPESQARYNEERALAAYAPFVRQYLQSVLEEGGRSALLDVTDAIGARYGGEAAWLRGEIERGADWLPSQEELSEVGRPRQ